jgi:hypothetical protein
MIHVQRHRSGVGEYWRYTVVVSAMATEIWAAYEEAGSHVNKSVAFPGIRSK